MCASEYRPICISKSALSMLYHYIYRRIHNAPVLLIPVHVSQLTSFLYNANDLSECKKAMELMYIM